MPSTYTSSLRVELQAALENDTTWGTKANAVFQQLEDGMCGYLSVAQGDVATMTLTALNGATDESRNLYIKFTGAMTAQRNVVCPTSEKLFYVQNATSGGFSIIFKTAAGSGITVPSGVTRVVMCDGTNVIDAITDFAASTTINGSAIATTDNSITLTNKTITIDDSKLTIQDNGDTTKKALFEASGITTATTRTITLADASGTMALIAATQNITNKTLDNTNTVTLKDTLFTIQDNADTTKQAVFQASGITTATTRTLTLPDASTTLVGTDFAQTLTNKTVTDSTFTIQDEVDNSKKLQFQASGITTATTRTLTFPDATDTIAVLAATQVLTNKTIGATNTVTLFDTLFTVQDQADATKQMKFELSGVTTGNTRTLTIPNATTTLFAQSDVATQSNQQTGTSLITVVVPGRQHYHPSAAKFWMYTSVSAGTPTMSANFNMTSVADDGVGELSGTIATDFSSATWCSVAEGGHGSDGFGITFTAKAAGTFTVIFKLSGGGFLDPTEWNVAGFGTSV